MFISCVCAAVGSDDEATSWTTVATGEEQHSTSTISLVVAALTDKKRGGDNESRARRSKLGTSDGEIATFVRQLMDERCTRYLSEYCEVSTCGKRSVFRCWPHCRQQHRGLIVPQLSATIAAASLPKVCIDPGVKNGLTASFVKCTPIDNKDNDADMRNNNWRMKAFCQCVRRFGKATHTSPADASLGVSTRLSSSTLPRWSYALH
jgi:hypothetical protein